MFVPENEMGVWYLFSRYHEKLGFEKILRVSSIEFPDVIALQDGKEVRIELEYMLNSVMDHYWTSGSGKYYQKLKVWMHDYKYQFTKLNYPEEYKKTGLMLFEKFLEQLKTLNGDKLRTVSSEHYREYGNFSAIYDPNRELKKSKQGVRLQYKSLKSVLDYIVCWDTGGYVLEDTIPVIELKNMLIQTRFKPSTKN